MTDELDFDRLETLAKEATPGPWEHEAVEANAAFIAAARVAVPAMIARIRELEGADTTAWVVRAPNGNVRFWSRDEALTKRKAAEWGLMAVRENLSPRPFIPSAGDIEDAVNAVTARVPDTIMHPNSFGHEGYYPHAAIKTLVAAVYASVPAAPTAEMLNAGWAVADRNHRAGLTPSMLELWDAMLAAAPTPPAAVSIVRAALGENQDGA